MRLALNIALVVIAATYLPLGILDTETAAEYWWEYALVVFVIAVADFAIDLRNHLKEDDDDA